MLAALRLRRAASRPVESKMFRSLVTVTTAVFVLAAGALSADSRRDYLMIVGSTTVYPMSMLVVERVVENAGVRKPMVQPTGSGGGLSLFCNGIEELDPDITFASRPIRQRELDKCKKNGVNDIVEVKIGYDGVIFAQSRDAAPISLTRRDLYLALAQQVPNPDDGEPFMPNPHRTWKDVNADLPDIPIEVWGPSKGSGTRYMLERLGVEEGCRTLDGIIELEEDHRWEYRSICRTIRDDQAYLEVGENDELNVESLQANLNAVAIITYGVMEANEDHVRALTIDGIRPDFEAIRNGSYLISRPLYLYARKSSADLYPGFREFLAEFTSEEAWSKTGYLRTRGLVPMREEERKKYAEIASTLTPMVF